MPHSSAYNLALPPRPVPWPVRAQLLLGGTVNQIGWIVAGFGMVFFWIFGLNSDLASLRFLLSPSDTERGVISNLEQTNASENDVPVYANHYIFRVEREEAEYRGVSYTTGATFKVGETVTVQYLSDNPEISRIQGTRGALFGAWLICLVGIFPGIGLGLLGFGLWQGLKHSYLLAQGKVGLGRVKTAEPTNTKINSQRVYKLTVEFRAEDGCQYTIITRTHLPHLLQDEAEEQLLYDPAKPSRAVMLDSLPGGPKIDSSGNLQLANPGRTLRLFFLPLLVIGVHGAIFLYVLVR